MAHRHPGRHQHAAARVGDFAQITAPGSFPVDPFFFLIGLHLRADDRLRGDAALRRSAPLAGRPAARLATRSSSRPSSTSPAASPATSRRSTCCRSSRPARSQFRRGGLLVATLSAVLYVGLVLAQYLDGGGLLHDPWLSSRAVAAAALGRAVHVRAERVRVLRRRAAQRVAGRERLRSAGARLEQASTEIADLQALNQHVIDSLPSGLATTDNAGAS